MKSNSKTMGLFSLAVLVSLALASSGCLAVASKPESSLVLAPKLLPAQTKARTSRSLSDMFEKMRSKIFGRKQQQQQQPSASNSNVQPLQVSPSASVNMGQRQPWADLNSFQSQYSPYGSYQFPSQGAQFGQQYSSGPLGAYASSGAFPQMTINAQGQLQASNPMDSSSSSSGASAVASSSSVNGQQQSQQQQQGSSGGGLLSSASHLIAQYLSPSSGASSAQPVANNQQAMHVNGQQVTNNQQQQQSQASLMSPQSQYNEFASILDSMVAQTGNTVQRQPGSSSMGQYMQNGVQTGAYQPSGNQMTGADQEMSGSSLSQSYSLPSAGAAPSAVSSPMSQPAASAKSSMVSLAEQLAPGAQFNKLVSFPFSISNNDDSNKEGRYKLHIPFLNQHVKRSDQQQQQVPIGQQQRQIAQQYLSAHYQPQAMAAAPSSPQQASGQGQQQPTSSVMLSPSSPQVASSAGAAGQQVANNRPAWSVTDLQASASNPTASISSSAPSSVSAQSQSSSSSSSSSANAAASSSSKLIPMASASAASASAPSDQQAAPSHQ